MAVIFTRTETGTTEHVAARNVTEQEAADLISALLRLPHITSARTR